MSDLKNLLYTEEHEWIKREDDSFYVGITSFATKELGEIVYVELPDIGDTFDKGDEFGSVETVKAVAELFMPIAGEIVEINEQLEDEPELVNNTPYSEGWMIKVKADNIEDFNELLSFEQYQEITIS
ncbi:MAG: glycine cleavage system protein GcvH [Chitinophagales bacterium]